MAVFGTQIKEPQYSGFKNILQNWYFDRVFLLFKNSKCETDQAFVHIMNFYESNI